MRKCKFCGSRDIHMFPCRLYNPDVDVPESMKKSKDKLGDAFTSFLESQGHKVVDVIPNPTNSTKAIEWEKEFYKQFYLSTHKGKLPKKIQWYFLPSDVTYKEMFDFIRQVRTEAIQEVIEEIKNHTPNLVVPINEPPFRKDFLDKWDLLTSLQK
jgi:hypothetical protein